MEVQTIAVDSQNRILFSDGNYLRMIDFNAPTPQMLSTFLGQATVTNTPSTADQNSPINAEAKNPRGLCVAFGQQQGMDVFYFADSDYNNVRVIRPR